MKTDDSDRFTSFKSTESLTGSPDPNGGIEEANTDAVS